MPSVPRATRLTGLIVGLTVAVVIATGAMLAITHSNSAARQQRLVVGIYETMALMRDTVVALQDAEIGQRGYLLTGDMANLGPYERARLRIEAGLQVATNYVAADFTPIQGYISFASSNNALYSVSTTKTNLIVTP